MAKKNLRRVRTGRVMQTAAVQSDMTKHPDFAAFVFNALQRHIACDWGDCSKDDRARNEKALKGGDRFFSVYKFPTALEHVDRDKRIWIITAANRSATTILYPSEY